MKTKKGYQLLLIIGAIAITCLSLIVLAYNYQLSPKDPNENTPGASDSAQNQVAEVQVPAFLSSLPEKENRGEWQGEEGKFVLRSMGDVLIHQEVSQMADPATDFFTNQVNNLQAMEALDKNQLIAAGEAANVDLGLADYNFDPMIARIAPFTSYADYSIANLEIPATYPDLPIATYPNFNMPASIIGSLRRAGIDAVSTATNHTLDKFADGAYMTMDYLDQAGMTYYGSFSSQEDKDTPRIVEKNGISIGLLAYTYGTNGMEPPADEPWVVNYAYLEEMLNDVAILKDQVDAVVVSLHLGTEYGTLPDEEQQIVSQALADVGVKVILGGHPHDLQPVNWLNDKETYVIYSQASFMTGQVDASNKIGGIHEITFERNADGEVDVVDPKFMPTYFEGTAHEAIYESLPLANYKANEDETTDWYSQIHERMLHFTEDFAYQDYLETAWTNAVGI